MQDKIVDTRLEDAVNFITLQQDKNSKCRGPFLAQMELQSRLIARRDPKADKQQMVSLMISYFQKFGSKQCAAIHYKKSQKILPQNLWLSAVLQPFDMQKHMAPLRKGLIYNS